MSGAVLAPALEDISRDMHSSREQTQMILSIYILAFAFGPLVLGPCSEVFGRRPVWIACGGFYILWNTVAGFSRTPGLMIASRVLSGLGASGEFAIRGPAVADFWRPEERGRSYMISTFLPLLGPALGPIIGGAIVQGASWRWIFWTLSIFDGVPIVLSAFFLPETYAVVILGKKAAQLRKDTGKAYYTTGSQAKLSSRLATSLTRPLRMLLTQPFIQIMAIFLAYNFGMLYIVLATFATLWIERYGQSQLASGLHYIALAIGYTAASQIGGYLMDRLWAYLKQRAGDKTIPEYRVPLMIPGAVLIPVGLLIYGWTSERRAHWIGPDVGIAIFGCGIISNTAAMQAYVTEAYREHLASASAASQFLRNVAAFAFPIFAPAMYHGIGYGWGNSLLALVSLALAAPAPVVLWFYGARLRGMGSISEGS